MIFTPTQIQELVKIIEKQHIIFIAQNVGTDILTIEDKLILARHGIHMDAFSGHGVVDTAFRFGILAEALGKKNIKKIGYEKFKEELKSGNFLPLTKGEKVALDHVKSRMYGDIKGLGNRISNDFKNIAIENSKTKRQKYEKIIGNTIAENFETKRTVREIASELGHKTKDWARDFDRISDYVLHEAFDTGKSASIVSRYGDDALVYKEVYPGACENCIKLYLTSGAGSKPRIFKISQLIANGTNIGLKQRDWKAVLGAVHPWCRCELFYVSPDHTWNPDKGFVLKRNTYGVQRTSRVKITID